MFQTPVCGVCLQADQDIKLHMIATHQDKKVDKKDIPACYFPLK